MIKIGNYIYEKSNKKNKKLVTTVEGKRVHFGDSRYGHFKDKTGIWSKLDHNDKKRKENYLKRARGIKDKDGKLTKDDPSSPNWHSIKILLMG